MEERSYSTEIRAAIDAAYEAWQAAEAIYTRPPTFDWRLARARARELAEAEYALRDKAAKAFAALNGWRLAKGNFGPGTLAKGGVHGHYEPFLVYYNDAFDHPVFFREIARTAAIVGQPYAPPNLNASWHNPGSTRFFVFTRPGTPVKFLPEQMRGAP